MKHTINQLLVNLKFNLIGSDTDTSAQTSDKFLLNDTCHARKEAAKKAGGGVW